MPLSKIDSDSLNSPITADDLGVSGNLTFTGTGNRITGDFSNATIANRVMFQSSTTNGATEVTAIPNGTSVNGNVAALNNTDPTNAGRIRIGLTDTISYLDSGRLGTGTYLPMTFYTGGSERVRVDTSGNVGVGTSTPSTKLQVAGAVSIQGTAGFPSSGVGIELYYDTTNGSHLQSYDRTSSAWKTLNINSNLTTFATAGAERMRIDSSGNLLVNQTSQTGAEKVGISFDRTGSWGLAIKNTSSTAPNNATYVQFYYASTNTGGINSTGTTTSYATTSDYRLKENIAPMTGALAKIAALNPCTYSWKSTGESDEGFIAHELQEVCPNAVTGEKDAVDSEGAPQYQGIDTSFLVATLAAAIQELKAIVDAQGAEIAALKGTP